MKLRVRYDHWLPKLFKFEAVTIYPFVLFTHPKDFPTTMDTIRHECTHVRQFRAGGLGFTIRYVWELIVLLCSGRTYDQAIHEISYEVEAYKSEKTLELTAEEREEFGV